MIRPATELKILQIFIKEDKMKRIASDRHRQNKTIKEIPNRSWE